MKFLSTVLFCMLAFNVQAQEVYPQGCVPWPIHDANPTITTAEPSIFMLHNLSDQDLWVIRSANTSTEPGLSSLLASGQWSALVINVKSASLSLKCIESKPGHEQEISCAHSLAICQWPKARLPELKAGIIWAGENMSLAPLQAFLGRQGYVLQGNNEK